jgi:phosphoribosylformylglycinamidine cyclo-ligase
LAIELNCHQTIGIDLVAMCANDLVVMGAEPLYFLDYFATGKLDISVAESVITGIANGCKTANCALIGGETAEMPGMYAAKDYDLAGFCVGIVEKKDIIDGSLIREGDALIALASSGPHSNGYSLIRHIMKTKKVSLDELLDGKPLAQTLLMPTRIYVKSLLALAKAKILKGAAHITGGGFIDNIPRILPENCAAFIDTKSWQLPSVFEWLQAQGELSTFELRRTLNCGVGMVVCVAKENVTQTLTLLKENGETPWVLGHVIARKEPDLGVEFSDAQ